MFGVQSRTMWLYVCLCCGLLYPNNSISNVVVSVTIHDIIYICICHMFICVYVWSCVYNVNAYVYVFVYVYVNVYVYVDVHVHVDENVYVDKNISVFVYVYVFVFVLIRIFHTLQGFVQRDNCIFEVLFPKC